ncbi:MAG: hypothetical protein HKN94_16885 [Acidimicrobiales bacterium]|nr:hypothetical protein [Acidimicrobiales bacterium]RZV46939.1 MAG: hypothetical protein EX269_05875 [Acidimicrobiales bacterium]
MSFATVVWLAVFLAGLGVALLSTRQTLDSATSLAHRFGLSPFLIGMTIVALGTDLPEIANSIAASASDHGDLIVGNSIGSTVTQMTLILGIVCFLGVVKAERRLVTIAGAVMVVALLLGAFLLSDEFLSRADGLVLIGTWLVGTIIIQRRGHLITARQEEIPTTSVWAEVRDLIVGLSGVGLGSVVAVWAFVNFSDELGVPEYATSFLILALGTSLPELFIDGTAIRRGDRALALGDIFGSSFIDSTVALGIGPALFPVAVGSEATFGNLIAAGSVAAVVFLLMSRENHRKMSGAVLVVIYLATYVLVLR